MFKFCILLVGLIGASALYEDDCPSDFTEVGNECYKFVLSPRSKTQAEEYCAAQDSTLVEVQNNSQFDGIVNYVNANHAGQFWVGAGLTQGAYRWSSSGNEVQSSLRGRRFGGRSRCVYLCSYTSKLWDGTCTSRKNFICKHTQLSIPEPEAF